MLRISTRSVGSRVRPSDWNGLLLRNLNSLKNGLTTWKLQALPDVHIHPVKFI